jgi:hypothetical protein
MFNRISQDDSFHFKDVRRCCPAECHVTAKNLAMTSLGSQFVASKPVAWLKAASRKGQPMRLRGRRTLAKPKAAKRRASNLGRKPKLTPQQLDHARELIDKGDRYRLAIADLFKVSRTTFYRALVA